MQETYKLDKDWAAKLMAIVVVVTIPPVHLYCLRQRHRQNRKYNFGYTMKDSVESDGPTYNWTEISTTGTKLSRTSDGAQGPFAIGFDFEFYDSTFSTFTTEEIMVTFHLEVMRPMDSTTIPSTRLGLFYCRVGLTILCGKCRLWSLLSNNWRCRF